MIVFTSCTNNYIPKARVLAQTVKKFHPEWRFFLVLGEAPPLDFSLSNEPFDHLLLFDQLHIPNYSEWLFRHRVVEVCTAAKGPALYHFLVREKAEKVIYLDPDIMVLNSLQPLSDLLDIHDILLTPHQLAPQKDNMSVVDNEISALKHGVYNLGFVAVSKREQGKGFATWWRDRLLDFCYDDIPQGLFTDQRWCDLAPAFFSNLHIIRDPGYNAASWNLTDRTITQNKDGVFFANNALLKFYHFTGYDSGAGKVMTERYAHSMPAVKELWRIYEEKLDQFGHQSLKKEKWKYSFFNSGREIQDPMRLLYRSRPDLIQKFPNPFDDSQNGFFDYYETAQRKRTNKVTRNIARVKTLTMLTRLYLQERGGIRAVPKLANAVWRAFHQKGITGVISSARGYASRIPQKEIFSLNDILSDRKKK